MLADRERDERETLSVQVRLCLQLPLAHFGDLRKLQARQVRHGVFELTLLDFENALVNYRAPLVFQQLCSVDRGQHFLRVLQHNLHWLFLRTCYNRHGGFGRLVLAGLDFLLLVSAVLEGGERLPVL